MTPLLSAERVAKGFARGIRHHEVLRDVSFELNAGESLGIWGRRACGKTTLLLAIAGLIEIDDGRIVFDGRDLATLSQRQLAMLRRSEIGWAQRQPPHSALSTGQSIALAVMHEHGHRDAMRLAAEALDRVGARDCHERPWSELTDGERTLAGIAGAIVRRPRLLVIDDPAYALNVIERERIAETLRCLADEQGVAIIMSSPDVEPVMRCHRIASLSGGRLVTAPGRRGAVIDLDARRGSRGG